MKTQCSVLYLFVILPTFSWAQLDSVLSFSNLTGVNTLRNLRQNDTMCAPVKPESSKPLKKFNPNIIQNFMAQEFIKSVANLFDCNDECLDECKSGLQIREQYMKPPVQLKTKKLAGDAVVSDLVPDSSGHDAIRNKRSFMSSATGNTTLYNSTGVFTSQQRNLEHVQGDSPDKVNEREPRCSVRQRYPYSHRRKTKHICPVRKRHSRFPSPRFPGGAVKSNSYLLRIRKHVNPRSKTQKEKSRGNAASEVDYPDSSRLWPVSRENSRGPPVELTLRHVDTMRLSSKWLGRREACGDPSPPPGRYDSLTVPGDDKYMLMACRRNLCRRVCSTRKRPSVNEGKTGRVNFPASHRCIRGTCPCRVTKKCVPPRTSCPPLPPLPEAVTGGRCSNKDLVGWDSCAQHSTEDTPVGNETSAEEEDDQEGNSTKGEEEKSCTCPEESADERRKRSWGQCDCRCGCSCARDGLRPHPQSVVGKAACGCSCGCGCIHNVPGDNTHLLPDPLAPRILHRVRAHTNATE